MQSYKPKLPPPTDKISTAPKTKSKTKKYAIWTAIATAWTGTVATVPAILTNVSDKAENKKVEVKEIMSELDLAKNVANYLGQLIPYVSSGTGMQIIASALKDQATLVNDLEKAVINISNDELTLKYNQTKSAINKAENELPKN
jgi:polysaccharide deacetylase 2 family uncharacterized protein YibQ